MNLDGQGWRVQEISKVRTNNLPNLQTSPRDSWETLESYKSFDWWNEKRMNRKSFKSGRKEDEKLMITAVLVLSCRFRFRHGTIEIVQAPSANTTASKVLSFAKTNISVMNFFPLHWMFCLQHQAEHVVKLQFKLVKDSWMVVQNLFQRETKWMEKEANFLLSRPRETPSYFFVAFCSRKRKNRQKRKKKKNHNFSLFISSWRVGKYKAIASPWRFSKLSLEMKLQSHHQKYIPPFVQNSSTLVCLPSLSLYNQTRNSNMKTRIWNNLLKCLEMSWFFTLLMMSSTGI